MILDCANKQTILLSEVLNTFASDFLALVEVPLVHIPSVQMQRWATKAAARHYQAQFAITDLSYCIYYCCLQPLLFTV